MRLSVLLFSVSLTLASFDALALTAVCKDPKGRLLGIHGVIGKHAELNEDDGMAGGLFTIIWDRRAQQARLVTQGSGGGTPSTEQGLMVLETENQVTFLVLYERAVWLYSLYPKLGRLLITSHADGLAIDTGGAVAKTFQAECEVAKD